MIAMPQNKLLKQLFFIFLKGYLPPQQTQDPGGWKTTFDIFCLRYFQGQTAGGKYL